MAQTETVKISSDNPDHGGYVVINKEDFDPKKHKEYVEPIRKAKADDKSDKGDKGKE